MQWFCTCESNGKLIIIKFYSRSPKQVLCNWSPGDVNAFNGHNCKTYFVKWQFLYGIFIGLIALYMFSITKLFFHTVLSVFFLFFFFPLKFWLAYRKWAIWGVFLTIYFYALSHRPSLLPPSFSSPLTGSFSPPLK